MRTLLIFLFVYIAFYSCSKKNNLIGTWKCSYANNEKAYDLISQYFPEIETFKMGMFEPIIEISNDKITNDLLANSIFFLNSQKNYIQYSLLNNEIILLTNLFKDTFDLYIHSNSKFCINKFDEILICFERKIEVLDPKINYTLECGIKDEHFDLAIKLNSNGIGEIIRKWDKSDSLTIHLNEVESDLIKKLVSRINTQNFTMNKIYNEGTHLAYTLNLNKNGEEFIGEVEGLSGTSFETRSLLTNLELLIRKQYNIVK
ncbi:MAG: hypothetical protein R2774_06850 [Saprospiraceae bacterium]